MKLELHHVTDSLFREYGQIADGYNFGLFLEKLRATPCPESGVIYVPSDPELEGDAVFEDLQGRYYGGMPIQIGYCNGVNSGLGCLEYHRDSEVNIAADDVILLLARQAEIKDRKLDTSFVKAFFVPAGTAVELYATTLHYAPCSGEKGKSFRVAVVLPKGTNTKKPDFEPRNWEDSLMTARNKWLLAHPDSSAAMAGAVIGLSGPDIHLEECLG